MDNQKIKKICIIAIIVILASMSIFLGIYFAKLSTPNYLFGVGIEKIDNKINNYFNIDKKYTFNDSFKVESDLSFDLSSEDYQKKEKTDKTYLEKNNYIKNLSKTVNNIIVKQDRENKTSYIEVNSKLGTEELVNSKYLIKDSTEYYFIKGITDNYVNNGTHNYFEMLNEDNTTIDNINYIHEFTIKSLRKNLLSEYFTKYKKEEMINSKKMDVNQISFKLTDKTAHEIINNVYADLKEDKKANKILTSIDKDFFKKKIKDSKVILDKNESYTFNIYTTKYLNKILKYEVIYLNKDNKKTYTYEGNESEGTFYYIENDYMKYRADFTDNGKNVDMSIKNSSEQEVGELKIDKHDNDIYYSFNLDDEDKKYDIIYSSKYRKFKANKSYENERKLSFKYAENKISILNGNITLNSKVNSSVKIEEDLSSSALASTLSQETKDKVDNKLDTVIERLKK